MNALSMNQGARVPPRSAPPRHRTVRPRTWLPPKQIEWPEGDALPLDVWWDLEDLWLRLAHLRSLEVVDVDTLQLPGFRDRALPCGLREAVFDTGRYNWRAGLAQGAFVRTLAYEGNDLVCALTPVQAVKQWPDGPTLVGLRTALLARLGRVS